MTPTAQAPTIASWARRLLALVIDWVASSLVAVVIFGPQVYQVGGFVWQPLLVFWIEATLGVALVGASFGQLLTRIRVHRTDGRPLPLLWAALRQALVLLVIPPLVFTDAGRGLHDLWTGSGAYELQVRG